MRAGRLRQRVVLKRSVSTLNAAGEPVETWTPYATVWAEVSPLRGREFWEGAQQQQQLTTRITMRPRTDVVPSHRAEWGERVYDVESVIEPDYRNRMLQLMCKERINQDEGT